MLDLSFIYKHKTILYTQAGVFSINRTNDGFVSGGKDGHVKIWDNEFQLVKEVNMHDTNFGYQGKKCILLKDRF